jgi:hypothetical protein
LSEKLTAAITRANTQLAVIAPDIPLLSESTITYGIVRDVRTILTERRTVGGPDYIPAIRALDSIRPLIIQEKTATLRMLSAVKIGDTVTAAWLDQLEEVVISEVVVDYHVNPTPTGARMSGSSPKKYSFAIDIVGTEANRVGTISVLTIGSG